MKRQLKIEGLDCPNCAKALEGEINKISGVCNAQIDFLKSRLSYESEEDKAKEIVSLTKQIEPNAIVKDIGIKKASVNAKFFIDLALLILGIGVGLCVLFIKMPTWLFWSLFVVSALMMGYKTYYKAVRLLFKGVINENLLITISVVGAAAIGEHMEALMVVALYSIGKLLEGLAVEKSRRSIAALSSLQPEYAVLVDGENEKRVSPSEVEVGQVIIVKAGEKIALDGIIIEGEASLDKQSLTGESLPERVRCGDEVMSGCINLDGVIKIRTTKKYSESTASKILDLMELAQDKKSKTETTISKITKWYTLGVIILALSVWGIVWAVTGQFSEALYRGLIFLVVSCPCAFAISVPLSYFSGLGNASKHGILIKGSAILDACAKVNLVAFDKTGTLTTGKFKIEKIESFDKKKSQEDILYLAALGEQYSIHPLGVAITKANLKKLGKVNSFSEKAGEGVSFVYKKKAYFVGRKTKNLKNTVVEVFEEEKLIGQITLSDEVKQTALSACEGLRAMNVKSVMLTGDNEQSAKKVAQLVQVDELKHSLLPQDKFAYIEEYQKRKGNCVGYVGDGLNDAPALSLANVGISMGLAGNSASKEASDIVLVDDNPEKVVSAIKISKYTRKIVWENIGVSALVKLVFLVLGACGVTGMLAAVFADVGVTLLAILNSLRALKYKPNKKS